MSECLASVLTRFHLSLDAHAQVSDVKVVAGLVGKVDFQPVALKGSGQVADLFV